MPQNPPSAQNQSQTQRIEELETAVKQLQAAVAKQQTPPRKRNDAITAGGG